MIRIHCDNAIARLVIDRPERRNAFDRHLTNIQADFIQMNDGYRMSLGRRRMERGALGVPLFDLIG
jgi:hypothetical protein